MALTSKVKNWISNSDNIQFVLTLLGVVIGIIIGFSVRQYNVSDTTLLLISFPGEILMQMLKCVVIPMIITSIISSLVQLDTKTSGIMGLMTLVLYICTTILAVTLSVVLLMTVKPGSVSNNEPSPNVTDTDTHTLDMFLDLVRRLVPDNIFAATIQEVETVFVAENGTDELKRKLVYNDNPNVLGIVAFTIAFGFAAAAVAKENETICKFFIDMNNVINQLISVLMWYLPVGVMSLVAGNILEVSHNMSALGLYMATSIIGLMIHFFLILPFLYLLITRKNPWKFLKNQYPAWFNVLGHSSSSAAIPITARCLEVKNHVDPRVSRFVLPVGAVVNIDGSALYEAMAAVFIAQLHNMPLSVGKAIVIVLMVTLSSVGSSCLPGVGLISVLPLLAPIPITNADVAMLITLDWFIDRIRTCNNVMGDSIVAGIVDHLCKKFFFNTEKGGSPTKNKVSQATGNIDISEC